MVKPNILVLESDEGFGFMLKEGLQNSGHYTADCVHTGSDALQAVVERNFDMVIIDMMVSDIKPLALIKAIKDAKNNIKIMMTPVMGQELPKKLAEMDGVDGVLPKPFFVGDLPDLVDAALGLTRQRTPTPPPMPVQTPSQPQESTANSSKTPEAPAASASPNTLPPAASTAVPMPTVSQETVRFLRASDTEVMRLLNDLNREVRAEAIMLIAGVDLIAHSGILSREECSELMVLVAQSSQAAAQAASFLGERSGRFSQSLHEGDAYRVYTLTLSEGILLSLALSTNVPLGMIRHQSRQIAEQLSKFII